jgi:hypothetical protein
VATLLFQYSTNKPHSPRLGIQSNPIPFNPIGSNPTIQQVTIRHWKLFTQALVVQTQQNLFLLSFGKPFAPLGIMQYICATGSLHHGRMAQWSAAWQRSADALKFESLHMQIILDQIRLDGIGLSKCI